MAAELAIKAAMIARDVSFPYTHDLYELLDVLEAAGFPIALAVREAASAASFPPDRRYPPGPVVTAASYASSLDSGRTIVDWAAREIASGGGGRTGAASEHLAGSYASRSRLEGSGTPDAGLLNALVRRIVAATRPERVILFGSAARGTITRTAISMSWSSNGKSSTTAS